MYTNDTSAARNELERQRTGNYGNDVDELTEDVDIWDSIDKAFDEWRDNNVESN